MAAIQQGIERERQEIEALRQQLHERESNLAAAQEPIEDERESLLEEREQLAADRAAAQIALEELAVCQEQDRRTRERLEADQEQLDADLDQLAADQAAARIAAEQAEAARQQAQKLRERAEEERKQLEGLRVRLAAERAANQAVQDDAEAARSEITRARERLEAERVQLAANRDRVTALETETKSQRRRIAREFQVQRATHLAELERRRLELQSLSEATHSELAERSTSAQQEALEQRQQSAQLRKLLNARADELNELRSAAAEQQAELDALRAERDRLADELANHESVADSGDDQLAQMRAERVELTRKLNEAEQASSSAGPDEQTQEKLDEMQRRFELAVEDVRDLKRRNAELETRLAKAQTGSPAAATVNSGGLDWEAQKRRMLAALEADEANETDDDDDRREERLSIESTINITDQVLGEKDREIADLKQLLGQQSSNLGSMAVGAQAVAAIFDQDELIRQERERLAHLQEECKETLRQAEIDISLERAKITRDRAAIDDKLAGLQADVADRKAENDAAGDTCKQGKPVRGRWLARLGLKDDEK